MTEPLWPPNGSKTPLSISEASVVNSPDEERPVPSGTEWPSLAAIWISPFAIDAVAISKTIGFLPGRGHENAIGLVPNNAVAPPAGATPGIYETDVKPTSPCSLIASTSGQRAAKWWQRWIDKPAIPNFWAASISFLIPYWCANGANPFFASHFKITGVTSLISGFAEPFTFLLWRALIYPGIRNRPWEIEPSRSALVTVFATASAFSSLAPWLISAALAKLKISSRPISIVLEVIEFYP